VSGDSSSSDQLRRQEPARAYAILLVSDFEDDLQVLTREIIKRYGQDYEVISVTLAEARARIVAPEGQRRAGRSDHRVLPRRLSGDRRVPDEHALQRARDPHGPLPPPHLQRTEQPHPDPVVHPGSHPVSVARRESCQAGPPAGEEVDRTRHRHPVRHAAVQP
jgi:hypothetical protein